MSLFTLKPLLFMHERFVNRCHSLYATPTRETLSVITSLTIIALVATYPLVNHLGNALPNDLGDPVLNTWILAWDADRFLHGLSGLWDAPMFYPYQDSLTYSEHLLGIALFTAPLQWLTGNPVIVYNVAFLASFVLAGAGMYLLATSLTGSRLAGLVGGAAFAFLPYRAEQISHLQVLMYGWMPVALWALHRYFVTGQRIALAGFGVAFLLQGLSNGYFFYFFGVAVIVIGVVELFFRVRLRPSMVLELSVAALIMLVPLIPIIAAYLDAREAQALYRTREQIAFYSADALSYFNASPHLTIWGRVLAQGKPEGSLFPGIGLMVLAGWGFVSALLGPRRDGVTACVRRLAIAYGLVGLFGFILSLGPEPALAGTILTENGPYNWLLSSIPGLDGLRAPARFSMIVFLALTVLAAIGARRLIDVLPKRLAISFCLVFSASFIVEGYHPIDMKAFSAEPPPSERAAYEWLATSPTGGAIVLPLRPLDPIAGTLRYVYDTLEHHHPIVNGHSGYTRPLLEELLVSGASLDFENYSDFLEGLRALNVRYVVVTLDRFQNVNNGHKTLEAIRAHPDHFSSDNDFSSVTVFELRPWDQLRTSPPEIRLPVSPSTFQASTSKAQERLNLAFDGNYDTRWLSGAPQRGDEWIELRFRKPTDIAHLRLWMHKRSFGDYPRQLLVEGTSDGTTYTELHQGRGFPRLLLGMINHSNFIPIDVSLSPNASHALRLRQIGTTKTFYWSIHEIELWTR